MKYLKTYESFEINTDWEFFKKHKEIPNVVNDVLSELYDLDIRTSTNALKYPNGLSVYQVMIGNPNWTNRFPFSDIKPVVVELISQLKGHGFKFYRYEAHGFKNKGWNRSASNIYNDHITKFPLNAFIIEFIEEV